jgi:hypothetical protein
MARVAVLPDRKEAAQTVRRAEGTYLPVNRNPEEWKLERRGHTEKTTSRGEVSYVDPNLSRAI